MINTVYRKIKEISAGGMHPRIAIELDTLCLELNLSFAEVKMAIMELEYLRLIKYSDGKRHSVKLTLLGNTVNR